MRGYAVVLAVGLSLISGYAARAALGVERARPDRAVDSVAATPSPERVWYGGTLAPIVVEATGAPAPARKCA